MKLYLAETGRSIDWRSSLQTNIRTKDDLLKAVEQCTNIPSTSQILMTSDGKTVKEENVQKVVESVGQKECLVFCFDRDHLMAHPDQINGLLDNEMPSLEPDILTFEGRVTLKQLKERFDKKTLSDNIGAYVKLFVEFDAHSQAIKNAALAHTNLAHVTVSELKLQSMALNAALSNLKSHVDIGIQRVHHFIDLAKKEMNRQQSLLKSLKSDVKILRHTSVHHSILQLVDANKQNKIMLADFVDLSNIEKTEEETIHLCNYLDVECNDLKKAMQALLEDGQSLEDHIKENSNLQSLDANLADIKSYASNVKKCREDMRQRLPRIYGKISDMTNTPISTLLENISLDRETKATVSASDAKRSFKLLNNLADYQLDDPLHKLGVFEAAIRTNVNELIKSKRTAIHDFFNSMRVISQIQGFIQDMEQRSKMAMDQLFLFKRKYGKKDLEGVRQITFAYGTLMIEMVRRKEYIEVLKKNSRILADVLADFRMDEEKRRDKFRKDVIQLLPFKLVGFDQASPQSEITLSGGNNHVDTMLLNKQDVTEYISLVETVYFESTPTLGRKVPMLSSSSLSSKRFSSLTLQDKSNKLASKRQEDNLLSHLNIMLKQMIDLRMDFINTMQVNFFESNKITIDPVNIQKLLSRDEPSIKTIQTPPKPTPSRSTSSSSSTFSVVEDDKKLIIATLAENNELKDKLSTALQETSTLKDVETKQACEIKRLTEALANLENEKEEFESHIQNLDTLVDNERQTFEQNRKSFLNELKNKDKSADFRLASAEEDFQAKLNDVQYALEEEKRMKKNLEIEHASELNTLQLEHASEMEQLKSLLAQEKQKTEAALHENWELKQRVEELVENATSIKFKLESEREEYEEHLGRLQLEIEDKEKASDEIKLLQQQTRSMVKRAQDDWESKNAELNRIKSEQEVVNIEIKDLLYRFRQDIPGDLDLKTDIRKFRESLEEFTKRYDDLQYNFDSITQELAQVSEAYGSVAEVNNEWRSIASHMAEILEKFRKNVVFELIQKLQLPMDLDELSVYSKNLTPSDDDTAIWNQVLQMSSSINTQKFVLSVLDHSKQQQEQSHLYRTQYRGLKEKYRKVATSASEKIAFRNFKIGDVALFLPTRNSSGKPWAAFNIGAPHYFLQNTDTTAEETEGKDWIVARIVKMEEHTVNENSLLGNPYGLANGLTYYNLVTENWRLNRYHAKVKKRLSEPAQDSGLASIGSSSTTIATIPTMRRPSLTAAASSSNNIVHSYAK